MSGDNPFEDIPESAFVSAPPPSDAPPARPPAPSASAKDDFLDRREASLDERERRIAAREAEIRRKDEEAMRLHQQAASMVEEEDPRAPNWPPCGKTKIMYQDFEVDIPEEVRDTVKMSYAHTLVHDILLLLNLICAIFCIFCDADAISDLILAAIFCPFLGIINFLIYRQLYKAGRTGSSLAYGVFIAGTVAEIIIGVIAVVGWNGSGFMGIRWCIKAFKESKFVGFLTLINAILWGLFTAFCVVMFIRTRVMFKKAGGMEALRAQAVEKATLGIVKAAKENPEATKEIGKAVGGAAVSSFTSQ